MAKQKIVIFANGQLKNIEKALAVASDADALLCADGGAVHCEKLGITPDVLIGDLDSISMELLEKLKKQQVKIAQYPVNKDYTDLELAVQYARDMKKKNTALEIHILGALGGRWDMSLANIFLAIAENNRQLDILFHGDEETLRMLQPGLHKIKGNSGQGISFLPLLGDVEGLTLKGFCYSAQNIDLKLGGSRGVSNRLSAEIGLVNFEEGRLLMVQNDI